MSGNRPPDPTTSTTCSKPRQMRAASRAKIAAGRENGRKGGRPRQATA